jgi:hypothetical protein
MHYQIVAKVPEAQARWDYYPYWAPVRDKDAAERLARYAAQTGHEAAILRAVTVEMLGVIAHAVVGQQDTHVLPAVRYLPSMTIANGGARREYDVEVVFSPSSTIDPYGEGPDKAELDTRRLRHEQGSGGDIIASGAYHPERFSIPVRMDILSAWVRLYQRATQGAVGGHNDGADDAAGPDMPDMR